MATNKVYSGRKSAVMVRCDVEAKVLTGSNTWPTSFSKYTVVLNNESTAVNLPTGGYLDGNSTTPKLPVGSACICIDPTSGASKWLTIESGFGAITEVSSGKYAFDFIIPSTNKFDMKNSSEVADWISFGSVYKNKMPTIIDWSADSNAKVDFGDSQAQLYLYKTMLNQKRVEVFFYLGVKMEADSKFIVDTDNVTVFFGDAYVTDFSIDAAPDDVANLTLSFAGDGELKSIINGELIDTDWATLLG